MAAIKPTLSLIVPVYNEADGLNEFYASLVKVLKSLDSKPSYEIIFCDDGSTDESQELLSDIADKDEDVKTILFSRNFGKESALSAGIAQASGEAIITIDGDGQHPVERISDFLAAWKEGAKVVIGIRKNSKGKPFKKLESKLFYSLFNRLSSQKLIPGSTDFRLIDQSVQTAFLTLGESNRITRGLIDWLGFKRSYINFVAGERAKGKPGYSQRKLIQLAMNSIISLSPRPLYLLGYLGMIITSLALLLGLAVIIEQIILSDPLQWKFTGTAMLGILVLFFVGIVLIAQGILAIYVSHIHTESKHRPLYIIDHARSKRIG
jgi:glycosyltransferase involved in cell wall biosynthesis